MPRVISFTHLSRRIDTHCIRNLKPIPLALKLPDLLMILFCLLGLPAESHAKTQVYHNFPAKYLPGTPTQHPRIYIKNRLPALKALFNTKPELPAVRAFKHDIGKLLSYTSATQDWRAESGWPAAALALHWLITGNAASGQKACEVFIPHFTGKASHTQETDLYYALAYDWLYHHPCFTAARKADLRAKLTAWSKATANSDEAGTWIAHDTDRNIATTAGHFIAGLAILGEDAINGRKLLKRGWTGWRYGLNAHKSLPDFPVTRFFSASLKTGIPLPGWDYGMMSDVHMAQNLFYIMDELGVIKAEFPELKEWWANSLTYFMHSVDPANTHYRWIGDQQTNPFIAAGEGNYLWSYLSNCVFFAQRYGYNTTASFGRSFLDTLSHPVWGIPEGDTMLWFMTSWNNAAPRLDFTKKADRYTLGGLGPQQHMGTGMFRSKWTSSATYSDPEQVTWGGFYGIGSYIADHMHNSAGSFWLWRNGEYLLTEPVNYGGNAVALYPTTLWNSLSIPNEAVPNANEPHDNGGPIVYWNAKPAHLVRGRADAANKVFYALLNANDSYDVPENIWSPCNGACRQPVSRYTRAFAYDERSSIVFLIDRVDLARTRPAGLRFRTQNPSELPTAIGNGMVSLPSDQGHYRTLIRVLRPTSSTAWDITPEPWAATVENWQIRTDMVGSQARKIFASAMQHRIVTALEIGKAGEGTATLDKAELVTEATGSIGACTPSFCFVEANGNTSERTSMTYSIPASMSAHSRHLVADLAPGGCYTVTSSMGGLIATGLSVNNADNTLWFVVPSAGNQTISIGNC